MSKSSPKDPGRGDEIEVENVFANDLWAGVMKSLDDYEETRQCL
jgi:hypothetical protein